MRILDLFASILGLIFLWPLFLLLSILIKFTSPGPVFYHALRVGKDGRLFRLYKFRSMQVDADEQGPSITASGDLRITPLGRFLRRIKLDELPQLLNVLKGEMNLVGPRPEDPRYVDLYTLEQRRVLQVRPGITSAASLTYRYEEQVLAGSNWEDVYCNEVMPAKLAIDLDYLSKRTVWTDLRLIFQSVTAMFGLPHQFFPLILADSFGIFGAFLVALAFRFDFQIRAESWSFFIAVLPFIILLYCVVNILFGLYVHIWAYASTQEIITIIASTVTSTVFLGLIILIRDTRRPLPLSVVIMGGLLTTFAFVAIRYRQRLLTGLMARLQRVVGSPNRQRVLIIGAGEAGQFLARQMQTNNQNYRYELVGFVDDNPHKLGMRIHGVPILGSRHTIPALVSERKVALIVIAIHNISGPDLRVLLSLCQDTETQIKMLPNILNMMNSFRDMLPLKDITPVDLLGRQPRQSNKSACRKLIAAKVVLVTGAAGSIGSELCHQVLAFQPRQLLLLDNNETGLYDLRLMLTHCQLSDSKVQSESIENIISIIVDVSNQAKLEQIFKSHHPQIVFHAAAYKHVPLMESQPEEAVRVNVLGTKIVSELAAQYGVERFVLISTDKAIKPNSIMGATKCLAEMLIANGLSTIDNGHWPTPNHQRPTDNGRYYEQGANETEKQGSVTSLTGTKEEGKRTHHTSPPSLFTVVRFGNVLGSRGSVVPTFTRQIELGGPVTITHPDMTRYFITISEAVGLLIQAAALTTGGDIFMLDMGQKIRIVDLAYKMIRLRGLRPEEDIPIKFVGTRPGEKLHEELLGPDEKRLATEHPQIFRIQSNNHLHNGYHRNGKLLSEQISHLIELARAQQNDKMLELLWQLVRAEPKVMESK